MQDDDFSLGWTRPGEHGKQNARDEFNWKNPAGQALQTDTFWAAAVSENNPGLQATQSSLLTAPTLSRYWPALQLSQSARADDPTIPLHLPFGHAKQGGSIKEEFAVNASIIL